MTPAETVEEHHLLLFGIRRSVRYHNRRRMFFERLHAVTTFIAVIGGLTAMTTVLIGAEKFYPVTAVALILVFSGVNMVVGTPRMARLHSDLAR